MSASSTARKTVGVLAGLFVAMIVVGLVEAIGFRLYPLPTGINLADPAHLATIISQMAPEAKAIVLLAWFLGALIGGWVATIVGRWHRAAWIVAALVIAGGIWSFIMIPHPVWMIIGGIALPLLAALLVTRRVHLA